MKNYRKFLGIFYILAAFIVIPLYNKGTFENISQHKVEAFYLVNGIFFVAYFILGLIHELRKKNNDPSDVKTVKTLVSESDQDFLDVAMSTFIFVNVITFLLSGNIKDAFFGIQGFGMGFLSILLMGLTYFYISRTNDLSEPLIHVIAISSVFPTVLAIINRLGYDPLNMFYEGENIKTSLFVSTLGSYSAFSSYMGIIIPIVCFMCVFAENKKIRILYFILFVVDIISIFMVGTTAVRFIALFAVCIVLFWKIFPQIILQKGMIISICVIFLLVYALFISVGASDPDFADGKGFIWELTTQLYRSLSFKEKFFGVGTNCYMHSLSDFLNSTPKYLAISSQRLGNQALTSAHSEYLDYIINTGITGFFAYGFVIFAALKTYSEKNDKDNIFRLSFLCIACYLLHGVVDFSNMLSTPYFFIFLGMLSYSKRAYYR